MFNGQNPWNGYIGYIAVDLIACVLLLYQQWKWHSNKYLLSIIEIVKMGWQNEKVPAFLALINIFWSFIFTVCITSLFFFLAIRSTILHAKANIDNPG